jgi:hypothetical protein
LVPASNGRVRSDRACCVRLRRLGLGPLTPHWPTSDGVSSSQALLARPLDQAVLTFLGYRVRAIRRRRRDDR